MERAIEALGRGEQTILIRNYKTNITEFLWYPTVSYASKDDCPDIFQGKYQEFVQSNVLPDKKGEKFFIKYFATVEQIVEKPVRKTTSDIHYI